MPNRQEGDTMSENIYLDFENRRKQAEAVDRFARAIDDILETDALENFHFSILDNLQEFAKAAEGFYKRYISGLELQARTAEAEAAAFQNMRQLLRDLDETILYDETRDDDTGDTSTDGKAGGNE